MEKRKTHKREFGITNIQANALQKLARYKYLTLSQMLSMQLGTTQYKYLWKQVSKLRDRKKPLVKAHRFSVAQPLKKGIPPQRVEDLYCLTNAGKKALEVDLQFDGLIKIPIGRKAFYKDYWHRRHTIDFQITLDQWAEQSNFEILFFDTYFDKTGNARVDKNLRAKTRIDFLNSYNTFGSTSGRGNNFKNNSFFIPDAAFSIQASSVKKFALFEMHNGDNTKRILQQIHTHGKAMAERHTHTAYGLSPNKSYLIVMIFKYPGIKKALIQRVKKEGNSFDKIGKYFRIKTLDELLHNPFESNWLDLLGNKTAFL